MININVKSVQNGEIVSERKDVTGIYVTFVRYKEADRSQENIDTQERLVPLDDIYPEVEIVEGEFKDAFENILLQEILYPDLQMDVISDNIKPNRIIQVWSYVDGKIRKIFSITTSCYGSGTWVSSEK
jgi:hypothetical protein